MSRKIRVLKASGTPYEIGFVHGRSYHTQIRQYTEERIQLVCDGLWSGGPLPRSEVLALAEACLPAHEAYAPDLFQELQGLAAATQLSLAELIIVGGFTDFVDVVYSVMQQKKARLPVDDCTAFIVPDGAAEGAGFFGQTWDMHDTATQYVILLDVQPDDAPRSLVFTTTGCVGQIGMNGHGICIGINNLLGADGQIGVTWPFVVRKVLQQDNLDDALAYITEAKLAGAHNYLLFDGNGRGYNIEAMSSHHAITPLAEKPLIHTNHCLRPQTQQFAQARPPEAQVSSEARLDRAEELLGERPLTIHHLIALTRNSEAICVRAQPPFHVESCGAAIMQPKTGTFWAVWGLPSENEYEQFTIN
ncbi:C45 family autoproteolytic acyltransferase/hydolase [Candidatus Leptofilum sp.]|uniref:C45 family autoproteolytic acyltransferase/hydolase n=1 Tax=Candidatus Leptofilum sp. TaxID=3241576 RepID=UPI003B5B6921